jgi:hypothetical protein
LIIDLLFFSPPWTIGAMPAIGITSGIAVAYWFWVEECYRNNGFYPYPIFEHAGHTGRIGLFVMSAVAMFLSIMALDGVYGLINRKEEKPGRIKKE